MIRRSRVWLAAAVFLTAIVPARANTVQTTVSLGLPLMFVDLDSGERKSLGAKLAFTGEMNLHMNEYPLAVGVYYQGMFGSNYGSLPASNAGILLHYFPFGNLLDEQNISNHISVVKTGLTVYGSVGTGLTFLNIRSIESNFGASAFNFRLSASADYPVSETMLAGFDASYLTTFGGKAQDQTTTVGITGFVFAFRFSYLVH